MSENVFVYDHSVMRGAEESERDPSEAILFFYPSSIPLQEQHELCSQLMGMVKLTTHLFRAPPKLFHLSGAIVACIHADEDLTFAYSSSLTKQVEEHSGISGEDVYQQALSLYHLVVFYHECLRRLFHKDAGRSQRVQVLLDAIGRYMAHVTYCGALLPSLFQAIPHRKLRRVEQRESLLYPSVVSLLEECFNLWPHAVLGGCVRFKEQMLLSHMPLSLAHRLFLVKARHLHSQDHHNRPSFLTQILQPESCLRPGVGILRCLVPRDELEEALKDDHPLDAATLSPASPTPCCIDNPCGLVWTQFYIETHSDMFLALLLRDQFQWNSQQLDDMHKLCFPAVADLEFQLLQWGNCDDVEMSMSSTVSKVSHSRSSGFGMDSEEVITFDEIDRSLEGHSSWTSPSVAPVTRWGSEVTQHVALLHSKLQEDKDVTQVSITSAEGHTYSVELRGSQQIYKIRRSSVS